MVASTSGTDWSDRSRVGPCNTGSPRTANRTALSKEPCPARTPSGLAGGPFGSGRAGYGEEGGLPPPDPRLLVACPGPAGEGQVGRLPVVAAGAVVAGCPPPMVPRWSSSRLTTATCGSLGPSAGGRSLCKAMAGASGALAIGAAWTYLSMALDDHRPRIWMTAMGTPLAAM